MILLGKVVFFYCNNYLFNKKIKGQTRLCALS
jgi:hypothetical protein